MVSVDFEFEGIETFTAELEDLEDDWADVGGYSVVNPVEYAAIIEFGRGPVTPTNAEALRFEIDGEIVFSQQSGPVAPNPMIRPAVDAAKRDIAGIAKSASTLDELLLRIALVVEREAKARTPVDTGTLRSAWTTRPL